MSKRRIPIIRIFLFLTFSFVATFLFFAIKESRMLFKAEENLHIVRKIEFCLWAYEEAHPGKLPANWDEFREFVFSLDENCELETCRFCNDVQEEEFEDWKTLVKIDFDFVEKNQEEQSADSALIVTPLQPTYDAYKRLDESLREKLINSPNGE